MTSRKCSLCTLALLVPGSVLAQLNVPTWRYDMTRQGQNTHETQLTPANVNKAGFGKLRSYAVDGYVYAQPLYMAALNMTGGTHNAVFVATEHDSVYAFDADGNQQLWKASLLDTVHGAASGATTVPSASVGTGDIVPEIGITGTPVIDTATNTLYVVAKSKENGTYVQRLHALDIITGNERPNSPVAIGGTVPGTGQGAVGGQISFVPQLGLERVGLLLLNGHVYFAMASHGDNGPYHGWVFAYDATTLQQTGIYNTSPNGGENGIWESGAGLAADTNNGSDRLFFVNGNGTLDAAPPYANTMDFGDAVERLDLSNGGLQVSDEWSPFDQAVLSEADLDQGSSGILILPDQAGSHTHELIQVGKNGRIELLDRDDLGGYNTQSNNVVQEVGGLPNGLWSTPAYWNNNVYMWAASDGMKQFSLANGKLSTTPLSIGGDSAAFPGSSPVITSNGTTNGVVWAIRSDGASNGSPAVLYAFDATNVAKLLYTSKQMESRDTAGAAVKFTVPLVVNGTVFVGAQREVDVYGLFASPALVTPLPTFSPVPGNYASAQNITLSSSQAEAAIHYTIDGSTPTAASALYTAPIPVAGPVSMQAIAMAPNATASGVAIGQYTIGTAPTINFPNGFASVAGLQLNGSAIHADDSRLQLTNGGTYQAGSFFWATPVNIRHFTTDYTFQLSGTAPIADGITFTIQNTGPAALGFFGGGLGYGSDSLAGPLGIGRSIALKFDTYSNAGEGADSTGLYYNGAPPIQPSIDLTGSGINFGSGDTIAVHETYDGNTMTISIRDTVSGVTKTGSRRGDITQVLGADTAYIGFTGGTGGLGSSQKILTWTFTSTP